MPTPQVQIAESWKAVLVEEFAKPYFAQLIQFLKQEKAAGKTIYPPGPLIFNAFNLTAFEDVRVVLIGQDPYHGPGQAHGLAFSVAYGANPPPSLRNIFTELHNDLGTPTPWHGNLEPWARAGVLLLNATLTVEAGKPASHQGKGWETFTDAVIRKLSNEREGLVFMLWGKSAQQKGAWIDGARHLVLQAAHPSPYAADKGFFGCKHFSLANAWFKRNGEPPMNWELG